jgi:Caspase domain
MPGSSGTASPEIVDSTRAALVVAAYEFEDPRFQRLRSPARDVDALAMVLADPTVGGFTVQSVVNQSNGVVQRELERFFSSRKPDDLLLVYFSCHGVKDSTGRLYFATTNTAFDLLRSTGVSASFVSEQMELTRSKRIVLLLDCCYSGAFIKGFQARGNDSVSVSQLEGRGRAVITASRSTEYAFEADELTTENAQPSVFTGAVVEGLSTGAADRNGDGIVTVDELYDFVYDHVRGKVAGQTPGRWVNLEGELAVARNPHPPVRPAELPSELRKAVESDVALQRLGAVWQLNEWVEGGDPGQQVTARDVLERFTHDYDERVRTAATRIVAGSTVAAPEPELTSEPALTPTEPAPPAVGAAIEPDVPTGEGLAPETSVPPSSVPPSSETPADGGAPGAPVEVTEVTAVAGTATPTPTKAGAVGGRLKVIGWLAIAGLIAMTVAAYVPWFVYGDGTTQRLIDDDWYVLWLLCVGGLAACAAFSLLGQGRSRSTGIVLVLGLAPTAVAATFGLAGMASYTDENSDGNVSGGFVIAELGCFALVTAAVLAATCLREHLTLAPRPGPRRATVTAVAAIIGVGAALALGELTVGSYFIGDLDVADGTLWALALRLLLLTTIGCVLSRWLFDHRVRGTRRIVGTVLLYALVVVAFLIAADPTTTPDTFVVQWYAALVVGATVVPVVSTMVLPRRRGAVLLAAWTVGLFAESAHYVFDGPHPADSVVLASTLVAAIVLAAALWSWKEPGSGPNVAGLSDQKAVEGKA